MLRETRVSDVNLFNEMVDEKRCQKWQIGPNVMHFGRGNDEKFWEVDVVLKCVLFLTTGKIS